MKTSISAWQEQALNAVVEALYRRHPELTQRFGQRGLRACREDVRHHLDYLEGALTSGEAAVFTNYALWLNDVLARRGVPTAHLAESFELLGSFFSERLSESAADRVAEILGGARDALARGDLPAAHSCSHDPALPEATQYRLESLKGDQRAASALMNSVMQNGVTLTQASVRVIQPAMYEVGRMWQENRVTVAQEHLATAIAQNVLARAYLAADFAPPVRRKALFAGVAGNRHSLGLRMLSDAFETIGWDVSFLGADVPTSDLLGQADGDRPDLICLSLSMPEHLTVAGEAVGRLRAELGSRCAPIWVGGQVTLAGDRIWRSIKADGWARNALHALEQVAA